jgi:hypothetical protein
MGVFAGGKTLEPKIQNKPLQHFLFIQKNRKLISNLLTENE